MQLNKFYYRTTKKGNVIKVVNEIYLRDDIPCGHEQCEICLSKYKERTNSEDRAISSGEISSMSANQIYILDTNVILHQIDLLEDPSLKNIVILSTVLNEVKSQNRSIYNRIKEVIKDISRQFYVYANEYSQYTSITRENGESPNDRNDRAIRIATDWYRSHLHKYQVKVFLITNDKDNLLKSKSLGIDGKTIQELVFELSSENPSLVDKLSDPNEDHSGELEDSKSKIQYAEHRPMNILTEDIKNGKVYQGIIRINMNNYKEGNVQCHSIEKDILVQGLENLNRSVDGDVVAVELLPEIEWQAPSTVILLENDGVEEDDDAVVKDSLVSKKQPTGKIVGIVKRNWKPYCGAVDFRGDATSQGLHFLTFVPIDKRIPRIRIKSRQVSNIVGKRIVVAIDQWDRNSKFPTGHFVKDLGPLGDKETESKVLLLQFDIPHHPFGASVMKCLPKPDIMDRVTPSDMVGRKDLRKECVFSVDPPGCTDIDDALHIKQIGNGLFEVGVHIADVSHFVLEGTAIDDEAKSRSTSVYLVDRRIDMLPGELSGNLCSLMSNVDRFSFSCIWKITDQGEVVDVEYTKSIIRSVASLTYEQAQIRIDDKTQNDQVSTNLRHLNRLAKVLRKQRMDRGALSLASPQVKFKTEEHGGDPSDVEIYQLRETNAMIEEFMLLANIWVAKKIHKHFPGCALLRRHPTPKKSGFDLLTQLIENKGFKFSTASSKELAESLDGCVLENDSYFNTLCRIMTTRCMSPAVYFSSGSLPYEDFRHYGLATDIYTHFTSPIRRYPDIIVHRLLANAIGMQSVSLNLENKTITLMSENMNFRHKMAQYAGRGSTQLHTLIFFKGKKCLEDAYIIRVKANAFVVLVPRYGFEGTVYLSDGHNQVSSFNYNHDNQTLSNGSHTFSVFDKIKVEIYVDDSIAHDQKLKINCIEPNIKDMLLISNTTPSQVDGITPTQNIQKLIKSKQEKVRKLTDHTEQTKKKIKTTK
ncbi:putative exoribonuclease [Tieghemostelium lacteum]|uniref:Ribosomal RNA-processing protein 44 n=1 Tax=Tieghemostelium lacteum TaxID=361077 RepID=A0A151ZFG4_TIELA|nr:putative exoribonuclease [Tieghemostelium lacteum]|eukprot:KYQ92675.1 putative exoribonuclease [Tieghemostelium lacteum]